MTERIDLPSELQHVADLLSEQPPDVRDLFRYAIVLAMIDDEKAWVIGTRVEEQREWLTVETVAGDVFEIARPPISEELEPALMSQVRASLSPSWSADWLQEAFAAIRVSGIFLPRLE